MAVAVAEGLRPDLLIHTHRVTLLLMDRDEIGTEMKEAVGQEGRVQTAVHLSILFSHSTKGSDTLQQSIFEQVFAS